MDSIEVTYHRPANPRIDRIITEITIRTNYVPRQGETVDVHFQTPEGMVFSFYGTAEKVVWKVVVGKTSASVFLR